MKHGNEQRAAASGEAGRHSAVRLTASWQRFWRLRAIGRNHLARAWQSPDGCSAAVTQGQIH